MTKSLISCLPGEVLAESLAYLDSVALCSFEMAHSSHVQNITPEHWKYLFLNTKFTNLHTQILQKPNTSDEAEPASYKMHIRDAYHRERGALILELGTHVHRVGSAFSSSPKLVPADRLGVSLEELLEVNSRQPTHAVQLLSECLKALGFGLVGNRVVLVVPVSVPGHALSVLAKRLLVFGCRKVRFERAPEAACAAVGATTAVVLDLGHSSARCIPVVRGYIPDHIDGLPDLTLCERSCMLTWSAGADFSRRLTECIGFPVGKEALERFKHEQCYARLANIFDRPPTDSELLLAAQHLEGREVAAPRFAAAEAFFRSESHPQPRDSLPKHSLQDMVVYAVEGSVRRGGLLEADLRRELFEHIIITGGVSALPGLDRRLRRELQSRQSNEVSTHIISGLYTPGQRQILAWQGAARIAREGVDDEAEGTPSWVRDKLERVVYARGSGLSISGNIRMTGAWIQRDTPQNI